nr:hypothetical protein [Tanacetum cinerariifolium]
PYEVLFGQKPEYDHMRVFGCMAYYKNTETNGDKFEPRGKPGVFLGYPPGKKGYKIYDLEERKMVMTRDARFVEEIFPFSKAEPKVFEQEIFEYSSPTPQCDEPHKELAKKIETEGSSIQDNEEEQTHSMEDALEDQLEDSIDERENDICAENIHMENHVEPPVYKIKFKPDGEVERYKARLVAKGCTQREGVDYHDTFAHVAKLVTLRTLLAITVKRRWEIQQLDVNNAFLHGDLEEEVYMKIPQGFSAKDETRDSGLQGCRPSSFPMEPNLKLDKGEEEEKIDASRYRRLVGRMLYLQVTRPDIAYSVSILSQFVRDPRCIHMEAANKVLRYLKTTIGQGILLPNTTVTDLVAYCDADWLGCPLSRRSRSGYMLLLGGAPISWNNFHRWSRNIKMALGVKLKLGFIDGSCVKPASDHDDLQRWIRCDYMVTCWILNSMVTELSDAFLYAQSACELWLGYPDWYKGKKAKKNNRFAAHVNSGFDEHFSEETPFDMGYENEVSLGQNGHVDQKLVAAVCQEMMKMFRGKAISEDKGGASSSHACILPCFTASFALFYHPDMDLLLDWISDSGASDHMSPYLNLFISTKHLKKPIIMHFPNGTSKTMTIVERSKAYIPQQNGVVEKKHRRLLDTARAIRLHANLPIKFWGDCILAATYLNNKMPMKILEWKSPYEKLFGQPPVYDHLRVIGCLCYAAITVPQKDKFDNMGIKCVLLRYPMNKKDSNKPKGSLFVHDFPSFGDEFYPETTQIPLPPDPALVIPNTHIPPEPDNENCSNENSDSSTNLIPQNVNYIPPEPNRRSTRQSTRPVWLKDFVAPTGTKYQQAIQHLGWVEAMNKELEALEKNNTWNLTKLPSGHKAITSKWVYKTKFKPTSIIERLKASSITNNLYSRTTISTVPQKTCRTFAFCPRDQDDPHYDAHPEGENSENWQKTSEYEAYVFGESSFGQDNEKEQGPSTLEIVARRANECIVSITEPDFKNLKKNDIEDVYLLIMNGKVPDYAETRLLWSLSVFIRNLTKDEAEYLKLFEEEIEVRLKYHKQMRRWEMYVNGRPLGPQRERPE